MGEPDDRRSARARSRRRRGPRSLTSKLVVGVVSLAVVLVVIISTSTFFALRFFLYSQLDDQLKATSKTNSILALLNPRAAGMSGQFQVPTSVDVAVLSDDDGTYTNFQPRGSEFDSLRLAASFREKVVGRATGPTSITTTDGENVRIASVPDLELVTTRDGTATQEQVTVVVGLSETDLNRTLGRLVAIELIIGLSAVVIAFLATTGGVGFSLRRLRRVTATAQEVAAELSPEGAGLDRRVPDDEPETEVGQLATSFNTMLSAVETQFAARVESEQRMRQFLADASHELRTPLTSIRGYAELARMQRDAGDTSEDNLDRIEFEGTRMSRLVEDLLVLARGDADGSSRMSRELIDVNSLLDDAASGSRAAFAQRRIDVQVQGYPHVVGDPDQLLRVVRNLVNNSAVHTNPDRPIALRSFVDGPMVAIQVIDGGPGLPPHEAEHVFERFWRADKARTRARGGSGLGLSIVAAIVRAHGGSVRFDSSVEAGSTVTVILPAALALPDPAEDLTTDPQGGPVIDVPQV